MFSNSVKYAIKAVLFLAVKTDVNTKVMVKDIAQSINVPQAYIAKLLQELSRQHIVSSTKGPKGGFFLSDENKKTPIIKIVKVIDGETNLHSCLLSLENCDNEKPCPLHNAAFPYREKMIDNIINKTVLDFAEKVKSGEAYLPL